MRWGCEVGQSSEGSVSRASPPIRFPNAGPIGQKSCVRFHFGKESRGIPKSPNGTYRSWRIWFPSRPARHDEILTSAGSLTYSAGVTEISTQDDSREPSVSTAVALDAVLARMGQALPPMPMAWAMANPSPFPLSPLPSGVGMAEAAKPALLFAMSPNT